VIQERGMHPLLEVARAIAPRDLAQLLPPVVILRAVRLAAVGRRLPVPIPRPEERDPRFLATLVPAFRWMARYWFRWRCHGVESVPTEGPVLIVANHSGGLMIFDGILALLAVWDAQGPARAFHPLAHWFVHRDPMIRKYADKAGAVPSSPDSAHVVLQSGGIAAVFPGSDWDVFRPFADRDRVVLGGRTGFVKVALRERVPLVPVVTTGAHEQFVVLARGESIAQALGLRGRIKSNVFPIVFALPWGITSGFLPYLPLPTPVVTDFLPPMTWPDLPAGAEDDPAVVQRCYDEVVAAMQARMDLRARGRIPWLGQV
jgi:1-acyl-sn-glycerol-3-phosphate acyltransferase